jgi:tRNA G37 N-methylase TrmD
MRFDIVTIFPGFFAGIFEHGIVRRAMAEGIASVNVHDLRAFTHDRHRTVDDRPFGGGEGMVLKPEPLGAALESLGIAPKSKRQDSIPTQKPPQAEEMSQDTTSVVPQSPRFPARELPAQEPLLQEPLLQQPLSLEGTGFSPYVRGREGEGALAPEGSPGGTPQSRGRVILLSAQGRPLTQATARELAAMERIVLICGRYEGVDERVNLLYCDQELSIGDYVLSGGELAAAVVVDAVTRLLPGALGNEASSEFESFGMADTEIATDRDGVPRSQHGAGGLLDYPHYTRPAEFGGLRAPDVLLNGDHALIRRWRREQQLRKTLANRPDLLEGAELSKEDRAMLEAIRAEFGPSPRST